MEVLLFVLVAALSSYLAWADWSHFHRPTRKRKITDARPRIARKKAG